MKSMFDEKYLKTSISILKDNLKDLEVWSVNNKDLYNKEIGEIEISILYLEARIKFSKGVLVK